MLFIAEIDVMPHKELLDPQGKTVSNNMKHIPVEGIEDVRIGKHISVRVEAETEEEAFQKIDLACRKVLVNPIMEGYSFSLEPDTASE